MLNESQPKPKPRRQLSVVPTRKKEDETNDVQIEIEEGNLPLEVMRQAVPVALGIFT